MAFPSTFSAFNRPQPTDVLNSPSHSALHNTVSSAIGQLEAVVGLADASSVLGTLIGDLRSPSSSGGGHVQTANKGGTGQTTFTKGDVLVATSSSVLTKLAVGTTDGQALVVDSTQAAGVRWGVPNNNPTIRVYSTASTLTWSKPSNLSYIIVEMVGAGGSAEQRATNPPQPGGGGSGGYARSVLPTSVLGSTETVVIGNFVVSSVGGFSSFGTTSFLSARGGVPGSGGVGGAGGAAFGQFAITGFTGNSAGAATGGEGASTPLGFGNSGMGGSQGYGAGGLGGTDLGAPGAGAKGIVIVYEY